MKLNRNNILLVLLLMCTPAILYSEELNFTQALRIMTDTNRSLRAASSEIQMREYQKKAAIGLFLPKISISGLYTHLDAPLTLDLNPIRDAIYQLHPPGSLVPKIPPSSSYYGATLPDGYLGNWEETIQKQDFWTLSASLRWPVFTGGKILAANRAAGARLDEANCKFLYTKSKLTTELAQRYFGLRLRMKVIEVRKEVLDGMDKHLHQARLLEKNGMIAEAERLHAEVVRAEADREYKKSMRDEDIARTALKNTLSYNRQDRLKPASPLFLLGKIESLDYYRKQALERNPVIKQIKANRRLVHQGYMKEMARYAPNIFLFGTKELYKKDFSEYAPEWFIGAGATFTLFDGLSRYHSVKAALSLESQVKLMESKMKSDVQALVEKSYNELMKDIEQFEAIEASIKFAEEYLRVRNKAFKEGFATSIDLVDAQLSLSKVKIDRLKALYEFDVSFARLLEVSGLSDRFDMCRKSKGTEVEY